MRIKSAIVVLFILLAGQAFASYEIWTYTEAPLLTDGSGMPALFLAGPYFMEKKFDVRAVGKAYFFGERIMSFDNPVSLYNSFQVFDLESFSFACRPWTLLAFSLSLVPWRTFDYKAEYHFPAGAAVYDGVRTLDSTGSIRSLQLSAICHIRNVFAFGLTGGYLFGVQNIKSAADYAATNYSGWSLCEKYSYSGLKLDLHAGADIRKFLRFNAFLSLPVNLNKNYIGWSYDKYEILAYPACVGFSASVRMTKPVETEFFVSGTYGFFGDFIILPGPPDDVVKGAPWGRHDIFSFLCGMKTVFKAGNMMIPFQLGYAYLPDFLNYFADKNSVFAGCDIPLVQGLGLSFDAEFSKRNWRGDNVFYEDDKLIDETVLKVNLGLTWSR